MEQGLTIATILVNLVAMMGSLWIGLYTVTRSPRRPVAWLNALMLWLLGLWFLFNIIIIQPSDADALHALSNLRHYVQFAIPILFHLAYLLRVEVAPLPRATRYLNVAVIVLAYVVVMGVVVSSMRFTNAQPRLALDYAYLYFASAQRAPSYLIFYLLLCILPLGALFHLFRARQSMDLPRLKRQMSFVMSAIGIAYVGALGAGTGILFQLNVPSLPSVTVLAAGITCMGYGVARFHAMLDGRPLPRDTLYSLMGLVMVTVIYGSLTLVLVFWHQAGVNSVAFILACAVITHTLYDAGRTLQERLLYRGRYRKLRADLRLLSMEAGDRSDLGRQLQRMLRRLLHDLDVREGFIALRHEENFVVEAAAGRQWTAQHFPLSTLTAHKTEELPGNHRGPLSKMALLIPIYAEQEQIAALVLGAKMSRQTYHARELDRLNMLAHDVEDVISITQQKDEQVQELDRRLDEFRAREEALEQQLQEIMSPPVLADDELTVLVEDALQHLDDYGYLGEHQLAEFRVVKQRVATNGVGSDDSPITHVERGKALQQILINTVALLRPNGDAPNAATVPPREWQPFVILHNYYVQGEMVRDITNRLYISERTYHRRRRAGIFSVAKSLAEMEEQA